MFLKNTINGELVEILDVAGLTNAVYTQVAGRYHAGEEMQDPENFDKSILVFRSGESLPLCWVDKRY
jgi:hypothetical protein